MIQVLIVDDHSHIRRIISNLLQLAPNIEVVDEAVNGAEAVKLAQELSPDVIVMDISMPDMDGFQALEQIQALNIPTEVVILSMYGNGSFVRRALQEGAKGYVLKRTAVKELAQAIVSAWQGQTFVSSALLDNLP
jgi:DNA-binding NarL/FixJ family response regulator